MTDDKPSLEIANPRYKGATLEMVALALLRSPKKDEEPEPESEPSVQSST